MTEENMQESGVDEFNPEEHKVDEVKEYLESADEDERRRVAAAEQSGKGRKSVLEAAGVDPAVRMDASGRILNPWEVTPPTAEDQPEA